jgi:serine-type D-Ala-D-Ala carboxypeptidase/endopeptidase
MPVNIRGGAYSVTGADLEAVLARHGRRHGGLVAGTLDGGERQVVARGGVAEDAIFEIGSITKTFTALLLAIMAGDGRAALDEKPFRGQEVTLADLATHTAGFPRLPGRWLPRALVHERHDPYARIGERDVQEALRALRVRSRGRVRYSNLGAGVLGLLLARRAGCSYGELVQREICAPLGMRDTGVSVPDAQAHRFAQGHGRRGRPVAHWTFDAMAPAGALRSTAGDLLTFLALQVDPPDSPLGRAARLTHVERTRRGRLGVGLGWMRLAPRDGPGEVLFHDGGTGGFRSIAGFAPSTGTAVVVLSDRARSVDGIGMQVLLAQRAAQS